jgi:hypothetical protein
MATAIQISSLKTKCPICGSLVKESDFKQTGLTKAEINILRKHAREATLPALIQLVDLGMKKLNPDKMSQELIIKDAVKELYQVVEEVRDRIAGPAVGKVGEYITIKDLKTVVPHDQFSDGKADRAGTDIVATIHENKLQVGKIAVSVKYDNSWKGDFISQLEKNMRHEGTSFGILVTKSFPKEALNDKVWIKENRTEGMMLIVKPEYAPVCYYGFRQAVIAWHEAKKHIENTQEEKAEEQHKILKAIQAWVNGRDFKAVLNNIDSAIELTNEVDEVADKLLQYNQQKLERIMNLQASMRTSLGEAQTSARSLKMLLKPAKRETKQI